MSDKKNIRTDFSHIVDALDGALENLRGRYGDNDVDPIYFPSPESFLEDRFERGIRPFLKDNVELLRQFKVATKIATFRIDYVATYGQRKIGFECDGREFHDRSRDEIRDALILGASSIDIIYRIRGIDITNHLSDCVALLSRLEPLLFNKNDRKKLENEASWACGNSDRIQVYPSNTGVDYIEKPIENIFYNDPPNYRNIHHLFISRRRPKDERLIKIFEVSEKYNCSSIDSILSKLKSLYPEEFISIFEKLKR